MRGHDWSTSPLGDPATWPQSLRSVIGLMLGSSHPMFVAWGPELAFLYNDGYAPIFGAKHPRALGLPFREVWSEIWADIEPLVVEALAGKATFRKDLHLVMERNGYPEDTWYSFSYSPVRDESGRVSGMFCACTETTGQVLAERQLASESERQRRLFEQAPGFITILNGREHVFEFVNRTYARLFGDRDFVGKNVREAFPELEGQGFFELLDQVYATGERHVAHHVSIQLQVVPDTKPEELILDFIYEPVKAENGTVTGIFCEGHDVTEAQRVQASLRVSEEFNRRILASSADCIQVLDLHGMLEPVNGDGPSPAHGCGAVAMPPVGSSWAEIFKPDEQERARDAIARAARGEMARFEALIVPADSGETLRWESVLTPILGADGSPEKILSLSRDITAQEAAQALVREGEARLSAIFAHAKVGLSGIGLDGRFRQVNEELSKLLARPREDLLSLGVVDLTHPDDVAASLANFAHAVATGEPVSFDKRYLRPNGDIVWANSSLTRLDDTDGTPNAVLAVTVDLTSRHVQEAALREETRTLDTLNRTGAALAGELELERLVQRVTDAGVELTGAEFGAFFYNVLSESGERLMLYTLSGAERSAFESFGMPRATEVFGPTFRNERIVRSDDILVDPRYGRQEPHNGMPAGHLPVRSYLAVSVVSRTGEVIGGLFFGHPAPAQFSERHERLVAGVAAQAAVAIDNARLYQAVQRANETLEHRVEERTAERNRVWEMSRDLFAIMGFDGELKAINPAWETTLGNDSDTLLSLSFREQVHPDDHAAVEVVMERLLTGETVERFEDRLRHRDGSWRWISWTLVPEGDVFYAVGRDITPEKQAADELAQAQEALRQSQKMEAMGQLTGGVAHDFNNLLTPIVGSLDMLMRRGLGNEREQRLISGAMQSAERAKTLVQRLLAFARRQPLQAAAVDLIQLINSMAGLIGSTLGPSIDIRVELADDLPPAMADANQLEMALLNLAVNARDAMPDGGILTISAARESIRGKHPTKLARGHYVRLSVADNGTGMDAETLQHAIEPFFSTKGIGKGTGLGLSMVHGLAAQLRGGLTIASKPERGTTVDLWLPISTEPLGDLLGGQHDAPRAQTRGRALLVDDEELVRMSTADMLTDFGYDVVEVSSGEEAVLLMTKDGAPDLLITDHLMPGMSGVDLARKARQLKADLPILIVSGYAEVDGLAPDLPRLTKPFRNAELAERLAELGVLVARSS
jgi:PAS domain S-box-containing protein